MSTRRSTLPNVEFSDTEPDADVTCPNDDGSDQSITCEISELSPNQSVTITVSYVPLSPLANFAPDNNQFSGVDYLFIFENGYTLSGSTDTGFVELYLGDQLVDPATYTVEGRNQDIFFIPPGEEEGFQLHLSCSEIFIDGYGASGPTAADHPEWKILAYKVNRYNSQGFFKDCGQTFAPIEIENTATGGSTPVGGTFPVGVDNPIMATDSVEVINPASIEVTRKRVRRGAVEIQYFNTAQEDITIQIIEVEWDDAGDTILLESASYQDGVDLGLSGTSAQTANINTVLPARSKDWLKLQFSNDDAPDDLKVTIVVSDGSTLIYDYHSS